MHEVDNIRTEVSIPQQNVVENRKKKYWHRRSQVTGEKIFTRENSSSEFGVIGSVIASAAVLRIGVVVTTASRALLDP